MFSHIRVYLWEIIALTRPRDLICSRVSFSFVLSNTTALIDKRTKNGTEWSWTGLSLKWEPERERENIWNGDQKRQANLGQMEASKEIWISYRDNSFHLIKQPSKQANKHTQSTIQRPVESAHDCCALHHHPLNWERFFSFVCANTTAQQFNLRFLRETISRTQQPKIHSNEIKTWARVSLSFLNLIIMNKNFLFIQK